MTETKTKNWQAKIGAIGRRVYGVAEIEQSIRIILTTIKGAVPLRPDFGCDAFLYLDEPITTARPNIVREVTAALARWEKRIKIESVEVEAADAALIVSVNWTIETETTTTEVVL